MSPLVNVRSVGRLGRCLNSATPSSAEASISLAATNCSKGVVFEDPREGEHREAPILPHATVGLTSRLGMGQQRPARHQPAPERPRLAEYRSTSPHADPALTRSHLVTTSPGGRRRRGRLRPRRRVLARLRRACFPASPDQVNAFRCEVASSPSCRRPRSTCAAMAPTSARNMSHCVSHGRPGCRGTRRRRHRRAAPPTTRRTRSRRSTPGRRRPRGRTTNRLDAAATGAAAPPAPPAPARSPARSGRCDRSGCGQSRELLYPEPERHLRVRIVAAEHQDAGVDEQQAIDERCEWKREWS